MNLVSPRLHRVLDFVTVVGFAAAPALFGLTGFPATLAYLLAAVHLILTLLTRFAPGSGMVPLSLHGMVELLVGIALVVVSLALGWQGAARTFYLGAGIVILIVRGISAYHPDPAT